MGLRVILRVCPWRGHILCPGAAEGDLGSCGESSWAQPGPYDLNRPCGPSGAEVENAGETWARVIRLGLFAIRGVRQGPQDRLHSHLHLPAGCRGDWGEDSPACMWIVWPRQSTGREVLVRKTPAIRFPHGAAVKGGP